MHGVPRALRLTCVTAPCLPSGLEWRGNELLHGLRATVHQNHDRENSMKGFARVTLLALAMGLTACGGSDDPPAPAATDTPTVPAVPDVATPATPQGLDVYVGTWVDPVGLVCTKVADVGSTRYPTGRSTAQAASITRADNSLTLSRVALTFGTPDCTGSALQSAAAPVWTGPTRVRPRSTGEPSTVSCWRRRRRRPCCGWKARTCTCRHRRRWMHKATRPALPSDRHICGCEMPEAPVRGVQGVLVKIAKLDMFEDCAMAIRMEAGRW